MCIVDKKVMDATASPESISGTNAAARRSRLPRLKSLIKAASICFLVIALGLWAVLALYFAGPKALGLRVCLALGFAAFTLYALFRPHRKALRSWSVAFVVVLAWFLSLRPSQERDWRPDAMVVPRITIRDGQALLTGYRDFQYRSRDDYTPRYLERTVDLAQLSSVDLFVSYWKPGAMAHTFLSFGFSNASPVCISIEARRERNERFAALPSLFRQFELIYVVGEERDIVRLRTNFRGEEVYLYPLRLSAEAARRLFMAYVTQINKLADQPEFYHLLNNSCTANIVRNANMAGHPDRFDLRFFLNGWIDSYLYEKALISQSLPFDILRKGSRITDAAKSASVDEFPQQIRAALPQNTRSN